MTLLPEEMILSESPTFRGLTLTTHRVRFTTAGTGRADVVSIMLEQVASCSAAHRSSPWLLALAALALLLGFVLREQNPRFPNDTAVVLGVAVAMVLVILYFASRRQALIVAAAQGAINIRMSGKDLKSAEEFIDALESAKNDRIAPATGTATSSARAGQ